MSEYSVPAEFHIADDANLTDAIVSGAAEHPQQVIFERKIDGAWQPVTSAEFATRSSRSRPGSSRRASSPASGSASCRARATSGPCSTTRSGPPGPYPCRSMRPHRLSRSQWIVSDSGAVGIFLESATHRQTYDEVSDGLSQRPEHLEHRRRRRRRAVRDRQGHHRRRHRATASNADAGQPGDDHLHLRHDRPAEGLRAHPLQLPVRRDVDDRGSRGDVRRGPVDAAVPAARPRLRPHHPGRLRAKRRPDGPHRRHQEPDAGPRGVPADLRALGAPGVREGLQHRQAARPRRRQGQDLRPGRDTSRSSTASPSTAAR